MYVIHCERLASSVLGPSTSLMKNHGAVMDFATVEDAQGYIDSRLQRIIARGQ